MANSGPGPEDDARDFGRWWIPIAGVLFLVLLLWVTQTMWAKRPDPTSWTELKAMVSNNEVEEVTFEGEWVRAKLKGDRTPPIVQVVRVEDEGFLELLEQAGVEYRAIQPNPCAQGSVTLLLVPLLMLGLFWVLLTRQGGPTRGMAAFGRSSASMAPEEGTGVTFADVAGID